MRPATEEGPAKPAPARGAASGFASLASIGTVFLITGLLAAWAGPYRWRAGDEQAMRERWDARRALEAEAASILQKLSDSTRGRTEAMLAYPLPPNARLEDAGSRLNLNWVRRFVLADSPVLRALFANGSPDELQAYRQGSRLGTSVDAYAAFFEPEALERCFTAKTPMNINTVDEFAFENAMAQATGEGASGTKWRERLRELRLSGQLIRDEDELRAWFGADWDKVTLFATEVPEWNANTLDPFLLGAVLACSDFAIADPASAASALVDARSKRCLSGADLHAILGLPEDNPIWAHLGARTSAWTLRVSDSSGLEIQVDFASRGETGEGARFRILSRSWPHA